MVCGRVHLIYTHLYFICIHFMYVQSLRPRQGTGRQLCLKTTLKKGAASGGIRNHNEGARWPLPVRTREQPLSPVSCVRKRVGSLPKSAFVLLLNRYDWYAYPPYALPVVTPVVTLTPRFYQRATVSNE